MNRTCHSALALSSTLGHLSQVCQKWYSPSGVSTNAERIFPSKTYTLTVNIYVLLVRAAMELEDLRYDTITV
jgi:hypothetical protein